MIIHVCGENGMTFAADSRELFDLIEEAKGEFRVTFKSNEKYIYGTLLFRDRTLMGSYSTQGWFLEIFPQPCIKKRRLNKSWFTHGLNMVFDHLKKSKEKCSSDSQVEEGALA